MRSPGPQGIAETRRTSGQPAFYERFDEERSMEKPLLVLRGGASALFMAPYSTRGPAGASRARRASRDERQRLRSERARGD